MFIFVFCKVKHSDTDKLSTHLVLSFLFVQVDSKRVKILSRVTLNVTDSEQLQYLVREGSSLVNHVFIHQGVNVIFYTKKSGHS